MLKVQFAVTRPSDVEQELTQKDQFDTDKVPLPATLIRESIQNTNDARTPDNSGPVTVRIGFLKPDTPHAEFLSGPLKALSKHLEAAGVSLDGLDFSRPDFLTIEDFGTTGLTGSVTLKDNQHFSDFWRRIGKSHKGGGAGGSWGLGKLVFPFSSRIYTVLGFTVREGDEGPGWLMGQTILSTHTLDDVEHVPHGFIAEFSEGGMPVPTMDANTIEAFRNATGITRIDEPGLSLAIPFPRDELNVGSLIPLVIEHYFFPILTGQLVVHVEDETISAETVNGLIDRYPAGGLGPSHIGFIKELNEARRSSGGLAANASWVKGLASAFSAKDLEELKARYAKGQLVHVTLPMSLRTKDGADHDGEFDLFLKVAEPGSDPVSLFVRNAITVPNESRSFKSRTAFGALIAANGPVAAFLRDAENPAHTLWNGRAEKLNKKWRSPSTALAAIRRSLAELNQLLENSAGILDADALIDLLNIRDTTAQSKKPRNPIVPTTVLDIPPQKPPRYRLNARKGGFSIVSGPGLTEGDLPLELMVRCGYAVARGNAIKRWDREDFIFGEGSALTIEADGAIFAGANNTLKLRVSDSKFHLNVSGFDINRDVLVSLHEIRG